MDNHGPTEDWVEKSFIPFTCSPGHTCKDCPKSKGCFFEQKEKRRKPDGQMLPLLQTDTKRSDRDD